MAKWPPEPPRPPIPPSALACALALALVPTTLDCCASTPPPSNRHPVATFFLVCAAAPNWWLSVCHPHKRVATYTVCAAGGRS